MLPYMVRVFFNIILQEQKANGTLRN
ncbi:hypothetical protein NC651_033110 [Populus alba x Populus x berolinensis]|nr:hypothetical protein NC651_033110 [Populus alba x Populus x berolinensis]